MGCVCSDANPKPSSPSTQIQDDGRFLADIQAVFQKLATVPYCDGNSTNRLCSFYLKPVHKEKEFFAACDSLPAQDKQALVTILESLCRAKKIADVEDALAMSQFFVDTGCVGHDWMHTWYEDPESGFVHFLDLSGICRYRGTRIIPFVFRSADDLRAWIKTHPSRQSTSDKYKYPVACVYHKDGSGLFGRKPFSGNLDAVAVYDYNTDAATEVRLLVSAGRRCLDAVPLCKP